MLGFGIRWLRQLRRSENDPSLPPLRLTGMVGKALEMFLEKTREQLSAEPQNTIRNLYLLKRLPARLALPNLFSNSLLILIPWVMAGFHDPMPG